MAKVICTLYSRHFDRRTGVEFRPELVDGRYVGVATVEDPAALKHFKGREGFKIVGEARKESEPKSKSSGKKAQKSAADSKKDEAPAEGEGGETGANDGEKPEE